MVAGELTGRDLNIATLIDAQKVSAYQLRILALCGLVMFLDGFDTQIIAYMAPLIGKEWHASKAAMGPIFSLGLAGLMAGFLLLSPLSDRIGRRRVMILSTLLFGVFTLLTASVTDMTQLGVLRFLTGIGLGGAAPGAVALTSEFSPRRLRATWVLIIYSGFSFGFIAAGFAAAKLLPLFGWRSLLWMGAALPLATAALLFLALPESIEFLIGRADGLARIKVVLRKMFPGFNAGDVTNLVREGGAAVASPYDVLLKGGRAAGTLIIWIAFFMNLGMFYVLQSWLPTILTDGGYAPGTVALITSLTTVGGIVAVLIVGPLMDRANPYLTVAGLFFGGAALVTLFGALLKADVSILMIVSFLTGVCISGGQKSGIALSALFYPMPMRSTGVGWCLGISRIGGIVGPLVVGWMLASRMPVAEIFYLGAIPMLIAGTSILIMSRYYGVAES